MPGAINIGFVKASRLKNTKMFQSSESPVGVAKEGYDIMIDGKLEIISVFFVFKNLFLVWYLWCQKQL